MFIESSFTLSLSVHVIHVSCNFTYAAFVSPRHVEISIVFYFCAFSVQRKCMSVPA